jgi:hypothetical protein
MKGTCSVLGKRRRRKERGRTNSNREYDVKCIRGRSLHFLVLVKGGHKTCVHILATGWGMFNFSSFWAQVGEKIFDRGFFGGFSVNLAVEIYGWFRANVLWKFAVRISFVIFGKYYGQYSSYQLAELLWLRLRSLISGGFGAIILWKIYGWFRGHYLFKTVFGWFKFTALELLILHYTGVNLDGSILA